MQSMQSMQGTSFSALPFVLFALAVFAIAYRYYSAFLATRVLMLDDRRVTPAHTLNDGNNYHPTHRWVLFGHHFAAISGAGPLIGPVLAAQFGFLPGFLWLVLGVVIGGAAHDFIVLVASIRHQGRSIAQIAGEHLGPWAGRIAGLAILLIVVIALAGLGVAVVNALAESAWGTFTLATTIPVAFIMGLYMYKLRGGKGIFEASIFGIVCLIAAVIGGRYVPGSVLEPWFTLSRESLIISIAAYGFIASVLPVWMLLCPRDYLSSYMKLGTIIGIILAVILVNPEIKMPMWTEFTSGGGPIVPGKLFPFLFITIACGTISGFHALVASGTTPKMISAESHARFIGYGAMLCECMVGIVALIAAASLEPGDYFAINVSHEAFPKLGMDIVNLEALSAQVGENVAGRPGGAVSLAVGIAQILTSLPGFNGLLSYWYHFAILFEALFILTTIDTGTRVARFLVQEFLGWKPDALAGTLTSTSAVVLGWAGLLWTGTIQTIWPLFGLANQLLAAIALTVASVLLVEWGRARYLWVTLVPLSFLVVVTTTAGVSSLLLPSLPIFNVIAIGVMLSALYATLGLALRAAIRFDRATRGRPGDPPTPHVL